jgi:hypothetical protein
MLVAFIPVFDGYGSFEPEWEYSVTAGPAIEFTAVLKLGVTDNTIDDYIKVEGFLRR